MSELLVILSFTKLRGPKGVASRDVPLACPSVLGPYSSGEMSPSPVPTSWVGRGGGFGWDGLNPGQGWVS